MTEQPTAKQEAFADDQPQRPLRGLTTTLHLRHYHASPGWDIDTPGYELFDTIAHEDWLALDLDDQLSYDPTSLGHVDTDDLAEACRLLGIDPATVRLLDMTEMGGNQEPYDATWLVVAS